MASAGSSPGAKVPQIHVSGLVNSIFHSPIDARIVRLSKILSTTAGVDTTLTLVGYSLFFVSSQLSNLQTLELKALNGLFATNASKNGTASLLKLADLEASMKVLASMCSDFRTFTRLWGLLGTWSMAKKVCLDPPKDAILHAVSWAQTLALGAYLVYENGYYLAGKGVLRGWAPEKIKRWAKISMKMFLAFVVLENLRIVRSWQLREEKKAKAVSEKEIEDIKKEEAVWWRATVVNTAYMPLGWHWASESGILSDGLVGAFMSVVGIVKFRAAWAQAA